MIPELESLEKGETTTIYPHTGVALLKIAKVWAITAVMTLIVVGLSRAVPPEIGRLVSLGAIGLWIGAIIYASHQFLYYSNTYLRVSEEAIIYRKGWIPSITDTIFWPNVKDINTSTSVGESMLGCGTIILVVAIRTYLSEIRVPYLPNHEKVAEIIREKVARMSLATRQVTYT